MYYNFAAGKANPCSWWCCSGDRLKMIISGDEESKEVLQSKTFRMLTTDMWCDCFSRFWMHTHVTIDSPFSEYLYWNYTALGFSISVAILYLQVIFMVFAEEEFAYSPHSELKVNGCALGSGWWVLIVIDASKTKDTWFVGKYHVDLLYYSLLSNMVFYVSLS